MDQDHFMNEAIKIIEAGEKEGIKLRIMGALAIKYHCSEYSHIHEALDRQFTDIDFAASSKQEKQIKKLLDRFGYRQKQRGISRAYSPKGRLILHHETTDLVADVFFDKLDMCHAFNFHLDMDYPTIPLADLVLEKLQIVKITEKDVKDVFVMLLEHEIGSDDREKIDANLIADLLANDWGFYYTITMNLGKLNKLTNSDMFKDVIDPQDREVIIQRLETLQKIIDQKPKSRKWRMRAKIGTKSKWYKEVHTVH
ncbi:MAG: hypothetical protein ACFE9D_10145, partial [Promethearchaeota archaeon]